VDAAQSVGKSAVHFAEWGVDLMSLSAHKVYGPKGAGALLVARRAGAPLHLTALQFGGGQEQSLRAGTVATHQAVGMGLAFELARLAPPSELARIAGLQERLWQGLATLGGTFRNGDPGRSVPHVLNVSIAGVEGEIQLAAVRNRLAVSTGSACNSALREPSYVLRVLGRDPQLSESSLRFGLGRFTSEGDIETAIAVVTDAVSRLRRLSGYDAD
jgi:cysteine desulfurase